MSGKGSFVFPGSPPVRADRRSFVRRAAGLGLALPALGGLTTVGRANGQPSSAHSLAHAPASAVAAAQAQPFTPYDPVLLPAVAGPKEITVVARDATLPVATDVPFAGWTFDGTIPGRALRVVEGDTVNFTFQIDPAAATGHSLDFHSAKTPPEINYRTIQPGEELKWSFVAKYPGAYMYHCGTPPILYHLGAGMYGAMIVDPKEGWTPAQEFVFVQSEFYLLPGDNGVMETDYEKMLTGIPDYVAFNGYANQYVEHPIKVRVGEPVRIFVVNAGPNVWSSFHVVGTVFDRVCVNANPKNELFGMQSVTIGPGDGACVEFTLDEPGTYPAVNHAFGHASKGAVAILQAE